MENAPDSKVSIVENFCVYLFLFYSEGLMQLFQEMGKAQLYLAHYCCRKAIDILSSLPPQHYETGWVLTTLGKAHFELAEYNQVSKSQLCVFASIFNY